MDVLKQQQQWQNVGSFACFPMSARDHLREHQLMTGLSNRLCWWQTNQLLVFTHRYPSAPLCAATHGPAGSVDVCSSLADHPAKSCVWLWDDWGVCFHGDRHSPRPSQHWAEGPAYPRPKSSGTGGKNIKINLNFICAVSYHSKSKLWTIMMKLSPRTLILMSVIQSCGILDISNRCCLLLSGDSGFVSAGNYC